jgi:hypothetical protein
LLAQEWLVSETELLPKVFCHEWWAYELTDDGNSRNTLSFQSNGVGQVSDGVLILVDRGIRFGAKFPEIG